MKGERDRSRRLSCQVGNQPANNERLIGEIAARQHGVLRSAQTPGAGISKVAASRRRKAGRQHRIHRGVYAVGHAQLSFEGRCVAAVLALGTRAVASHQADPPIPLRHRRCYDLPQRHRGDQVGRTLRGLHRTSPQPVFRRALRRALDLRLVSSADVRLVAYLTRSELERIWWTDLPSLRPCTPCSA